MNDYGWIQISFVVLLLLFMFFGIKHSHERYLEEKTKCLSKGGVYFIHKAGSICLKPEQVIKP